MPASDADGSVNPSNPNDQFPIDLSNVPWQDSGGLGGDWGIYAVFPNNNTGERAHWRGFFRPTQVVPAVNTSLRITGYGNDNTPTGSAGGFNNDHRTEQTSTGPFVGEIVNGATSTRLPHRHRAGQLRQPDHLADRQRGFLDRDPHRWRLRQCRRGLEQRHVIQPGRVGHGIEQLSAGRAASVIFDTASSTGTQNGSLYEPFRNFGAAYNSAPNGGQVLMVTGGYPQATAGNTGTFGSGQTKSVTLRAPVGAATIGN